MTIREPREGPFPSGEVLLDVPQPPPEQVRVPARRHPVEVPARAKKPDYRLRGLDFEAAALTGTPARPTRSKHPSRRRRRRRLVLQWLVVLTLLAASAVLLRASVITPYSVRTTSMVPTLTPGTNVVVLRPKMLTGAMKAGDLVVFRRPAGFTCSAAGGTSNDYLKRVIGLPGQTIWSAGNRIYVNGKVLHEPGWYNPPFGELAGSPIARTVIPAGSYFLLGDNRTDPCDSRAFGPVSGSSFVGKVLATTTRSGHPYVHFF